MSKKTVKVIVLRTAGTNCDSETVHAFRSFGASVDQVHVNELLSGKKKLAAYHILAVPGGFTYGDDIISGRILANELRLKLGEDVKKFIADEKLIIGICNGFQVLVRAGILPGDEQRSLQQTASLTYNDSGKFEDRWTYLKKDGHSVWTQGLPEMIYIPVAHAEGKFVANEDLLNSLRSGGQVAFRYCSPQGDSPEYPQNPNGSVDDIAGVTDSTGRILGLMPHPERHFRRDQHPYWTRRQKGHVFGDGAKVFENGVQYVKERLL